jgi:uncharacterized membrane protein YfcA
MLFGTGVAGGVVTAIVGGATLITFPALMAAGLPAIVANASSAVAMTPGNFMGAVADLGRLPRADRAFAGLIVVCVLGGLAGAGLLLMTPERAFTMVVPLLIGLATALFAAAERIERWTRAWSGRGDGGPATGLRLLLLAPVTVYGGYFGAGLSVMLLAILSVTGTNDFRNANVVKNLLSGLTGLVAVVVFIVQGIVAWPQALAMMGGALVGGLLGGRLVRVFPQPLIRVVVITVGTILTLVYAWRYWLP